MISYITMNNPELRNESHSLSLLTSDKLSLNCEKEIAVDKAEKTIGEACQQGLLEDIKELHKKDENKLRELDENGWSALHYSSRFNQCHIIKYLVKVGVDVDIVAEGEDVTPLHLAIRHNCLDAVRCLLNNGASPSMKNSNGESAIHFVGKRGDKDLISTLLSNHQTSLNEVDKNHRTALHHACFYGNPVACETLLNHAANLEGTTVEGLTPLHIAVMGGHENIVKLLIKRAKERSLKMKEYVNIADNNGTTALHLSASGGQFNIMEILLRHEADVNIRRNLSGRGFSALHAAANGGDLKMCRLLLSHNATLDLKDSDGCTPLHRAAARNHQTVVTFLLTKGSALTSVDKDGLTSFLHGVKEGYTMLAELILKRNLSQINQRTKKLRCSIHLSVMNRQKPMLLMLLKNGGSKYTNAIDCDGRTPLHCAVALGDSETIRILLDHGSNPSTIDNHSQTPLHLACETKRLTCVKLIMDQATTTLNFLDDRRKTALHITSQNGDIPVTNYLLRLGADVSLTDTNGDTPLHNAVRCGSLGVCTSLLDHHAPCDVQNGDLDTPLHEAAKGECPKITVLLLEKKANTELRNKNDKTFLDLAIDNCNYEVLEAIMNHHRIIIITTVISLFSMVKYSNISKRTEAITRMVHTHPNVAIALLDRCMTFSEHGPNDKDFKVTYDFHLLDPGPSAGRGRFTTLKSLVEHRQEKILSHPLVRKMLSRKWTVIGRNLYLLGLLFFFAFHLTLSWLTISERMRATFSGNTTTYAKEFAEHYDRNIIVMALLTTFAIVNIAKEIFQMFLRGSRYFTNHENLVEIVYYLTTIIFLFPYLHLNTKNDQRIPKILLTGQNWQFGILAVFFGWINFVLYLRSYMFPTLGLYITMFFEILKTFLRILSVIILFLFGFANVFYIVFPQQDTFPNIWTSLMTTAVMMTGELGYRETLIDTSGSKLLPFPVLSFIIFGIFIVTMAILLANLLSKVTMVFTNEDKAIIEACFNEKGWTGNRIVKEFPGKNWNRRSVYRLIKKIKDTGSASRKPEKGKLKKLREVKLSFIPIGLAVGDIDGVQNNANMSLISMPVDYVTEIEEKLPFFIQNRFYEPSLTEKPNEPPSRKEKVFKYILWHVTGDPSCSTQYSVTQVMRNRFQKGKYEDSQKISRMEARLNEQQRSIRQLKKLIQNQNKLLQAMTESLGLINGNENGQTIADGLSTVYGYRSTYS